MKFKHGDTVAKGAWSGTVIGYGLTSKTQYLVLVETKDYRFFVADENDLALIQKVHDFEDRTKETIIDICDQFGKRMHRIVRLSWAPITKDAKDG